jgi:predicted  nucleic acid-binding Zn-ribbon protein
MEPREDLRGLERALEVERWRNRCLRCNGSGSVLADSVERFMRGHVGCPDCGGNGLKAGTGRRDRRPPANRDKGT